MIVVIIMMITMMMILLLLLIIIVITVQQTSAPMCLFAKRPLARPRNMTISDNLAPKANRSSYKTAF